MNIDSPIDMNRDLFISLHSLKGDLSIQLLKMRQKLKNPMLLIISPCDIELKVQWKSVFMNLRFL